jgi:apolipoprotein N-acyltransferase
MVNSKFTKLTASAKGSLPALGVGVLLSMPFWLTWLGWFVIPCVTVYLWWLSKKPFICQIWLSGVGFFAFVVNWVYQIRATELIPNNILALAFLVLTFTIVVGSLSLGFLLFGWAYHKFGVDIDRPQAIIVIPALWALSEWARSLMFSVVSMGPGGSFGPHWNFGSLAFAASVTPLGYAGRIVGQFGLSALVVALAIGFMWLLHKQWRQGLLVITAVTLIAVAGWSLSPSAKASELRTGVLQLDDSSYSDYGYQRDLDRLTASRDAKKPLDILVMPEYSYLFENEAYKQDELSALSKITKENSLIITSRSGQAQEGHKNLVTVYTSDSRVVAQQEKQFLIPAGEYIPYFYEWILVLSGNTSVIGNHQANNTITPAQQAARPIAYKSDAVGALACSGAIAPDYYRVLAREGATILTNSAALSTMGLSGSYYAQARQMAHFIAISTARPFVQSARGAEVYMLDSNGREVAASNKSGIHYIEADIATNSRRTPYAMAGDLVVLFAAMVGLVLIWKINK